MFLLWLFMLTGSWTAPRAQWDIPMGAERLGDVICASPSPQPTVQGTSEDIAWTVSISPPHLSYRQRIQSQVVVVVPARYLASSALAPMFELSISARDKETRAVLKQNTIWASTTRSMPRRGEVRITDETDLVIQSSVLLLPGEYYFDIALRDHTNARSTKQSRPLSVRPRKKEAWPSAWANLPKVEFLVQGESPATYEYLAADRSRLALPLKTRRAIHVDLIVNCCVPPTVLSNLDVLSQVQIENGTFSLRVLDLLEPKVVYEQLFFRRLDASRLLRSLERAKPVLNAYDMPPSEQRHSKFFREVLTALLKPENEGDAEKGLGRNVHNDRVWIVIVLSRPTVAPKGGVGSPIACGAHCPERVYYLRQIGEPELDFERQVQQGAVFANPVSAPPVFYDPINSLGLPKGHYVDTSDEVRDGLPKMMKGMGLRIMRVGTPLEMRKALLRILGEIEQIGK